MNIQILVGIVTYNSLGSIETCLSRLREQTYHNFHIVIFDNASVDGTITWLRAIQDDNVTCVYNALNIGYGNAHNYIMTQFRLSSHYLALNPDAYLEANYIQRLVFGMQYHTAHWVIGKLFLDDTYDTLYSIGHGIMRNGYAFHIGYGLPSSTYCDDREIFGASGAAVLYSDEFMQKIGSPFFDPNLFMYYEDIDVDWRGQHSGLKCYYIADALAIHPGGSPSDDLISMSLAHRYLVCLKNSELSALVVVIFPLMILHLCFRLIMKPKSALRIVSIFLSLMRMMLEQRQASQHNAGRMQYWYRMSQAELTTQPKTLWQRLATFMNTRFLQ